MRVVDGEDGAVRNVGIACEPHFLVAGDARRVEFGEFGVTCGGFGMVAGIF